MTMQAMPFGYRLVNGKAEINEEEAAIFRSFCKDYLSGLSYVAAAKKNGLNKYHGSLKNMIENPRYLGNDFYPALLDQETVDALKAERLRREKKLGRSSKARRVSHARIYTEFRIEKPQTKHSDAYEQAAYIYSLITAESEVNENAELR